MENDGRGKKRRLASKMNMEISSCPRRERLNYFRVAVRRYDRFA